MNTRPYILIIDSPKSDAHRIQKILQHTGYHVHRVCDGADGWLTAHETKPNLILLHVNSTTLNGIRVLALLKYERSTAHIPVIMLAPKTDLHKIEQAIANGADGYIFEECIHSIDNLQYLTWEMQIKQYWNKGTDTLCSQVFLETCKTL